MVKSKKSGFIKAKKSLGQNFCIDENLIKEIIDSLEATNEHEVWEIGPGKGALSKDLTSSGAELRLFEIDERMKDELDRLGLGAKVMWGDFLELEELPEVQRPLLVCGNLPYYCATPIIRKFLEEGPLAERIVFLLQREVAEKVAAKVGEKNYSYLSLHTGLFAKARLGGIYKPESFRPPPKIDSRILILEPLELTDEERGRRMELLKFASVLFGQRRKMALTTLKKQLPSKNWEALFEELHIDKKARPENISMEQMLKLFVDI